MATDYDSPRKTDDEMSEDSLEELKARRQDKSAGAVDVDEADLAESLELRLPLDVLGADAVPAGREGEPVRDSRRVRASEGGPVLRCGRKNA